MVSERIATIKRNNSNQLSVKVNRIELLLDMKLAVLQIKEKGASSWLMIIPMQEYGFALTKSEFREMHFEFDTISNYKECLINVHGVKNTI